MSKLLEETANEAERLAGLDIADYIIKELRNNVPKIKIRQQFSPEVEYLIQKNNALLILIDRFELVEVRSNAIDKNN